MIGLKRNKGKRQKVDRNSGRPIYSYYANGLSNEPSNQTSRSSTQSSKSRFQWLQNAPMFIASIVVVVSFLYILKLDTNPKIVQINDGENVFLKSSNTYSDTVSKLFKSSWFNQNKVTVNAEGISNQIETQFPEISKASITLPLFGHRPIVYLVSNQPSIVLDSVNGKYVINEKGVAVAAIDESKVYNNLTVITDSSTLNVELGKSALTTEQVLFINVATKMLAASKITIEKGTLPLSSNELQLYQKGKSYYIKFDMISDVKEQVGRALATIHYLKMKNISPRQYIDVRVSGKIYYR